MKQIIINIKKQPMDEILLLIFVFCIPFQLRTILNSDQAYIGAIFSYHKAIFIYLTDLIFVAAYLSWILFNKQNAKPNKWLILPIFFIGISLFHVEQLSLGLYSSLKLIEFFLLVDYVKQKPKMFHSICFTAIFSGFIQASIGIIQFHVQHNLGFQILGEYFPSANLVGAATLDSASGKITRSYGTFSHPNIYGGYLSLILAIFLYVSRETIGRISRVWPNTIVSCGTFLLIWGITLSFSRSAWIAGFITLITGLITYIFQKNTKKATLLAIITIVSCGTMFIAYKTYIIPRSIDLKQNSQAVELRSEFNNQAISIIKAYPILGVGFGHYITAHERLFHVEQWKHQPPHNIFLFILAELGILGLIVYFLTLIKICFTWNILKNGLFIMLLFPLLVLAMFDHYLVTIQQGILIFGLICGLISQKDVSQAVKHLE